MQEDVPELLARSQTNLIDFLRTDLQVAFTFLDTARIDIKDVPAHCKALLAKAREALDSIRHLAPQIDDSDARKDILARADELESAIGGVLL
jgi:hypothetical protein